jgi:hypothetical protein
VGDHDPELPHHSFQVAIAQPVGDVPANAVMKGKKSHFENETTDAVVYVRHEPSTCSSVEICLSNQHSGGHPLVRCVIERAACLYA